MNKYIKINKILKKKHVISRPLNSIAFKGSQKYITLCIDVSTMIIVIIRHQWDDSLFKKI